MHNGAAAVTIWTETDGVLDLPPLQFGTKPAMVEFRVPELQSLSGGHIVAFHGVIGDAIQKLGAVIQARCSS